MLYERPDKWLRWHVVSLRFCQALLLSLCFLTACASSATQRPVTPSGIAVTASVSAEPAATAPPTAGLLPSPTALVVTPLATPEPQVADFFYGVMQPVSAVTDIRSPAQVGEAMRHIKALGSNITLQLFQQELTAEDWQIYLDVAQQEGMLVIGRLGPPDWNPDPADLSPILDVLALVAEHPALYGFVYLHEPWEVMDTSQMQDIYHEIKGHYPTLRLGVIWSGEIEKSIRRLDPLRQYTADLCDICIINLKAFQNDPQSAEDQGLNRLKVSAEVIQAITPEVELWSSVQVWAPLDGGRRGFRVPQPDEMATLFCAIKAAYPLRGFMWASWALDMPEAPTLDSSELMAQRQAVGDIYNSCVRQS